MKRGNTAGKILLTVFVMAVYSLLGSFSVNAQEDYFSEDYKYTVRIYSGAQGTFADGSTMITIKAAHGSTISLTDVLDSIQMKKVEDITGNLVESKYYAKGIRESGKDNNTVDSLMGPVFTITCDADYVVSYAMKGGNISYTVKYVEAETGKELLPEETYYGNIGEKPVVAYKYVDGYIPKAYNLAKTLNEDEKQTVFVFEYQKGEGTYYFYYTEEGDVVYVDRTGETITDYIPGNTVVIEGPSNGVRVIPSEPVPAVSLVGEGNRTTHENPTAASREADANQETKENAQPSDPVDLIDLDEEQVPLSDSAGMLDALFQNDANSSVAVVAKYIFLILLLVIAGGVATVIYTRKRSRKDREEKEE